MASAQEFLTSLNRQTLFDLDGLVAVVTGGTSGLGLYIALTLLANGAKVYVVDISDKGLELVKPWTEAANGRLIGIKGDISMKEEAKRIVSEVAQNETYINVLFNNAGILVQGHQIPVGSKDVQDYVNALDTFETASFSKTFDVNTIGQYFMSVAFLPLLDAAKTHDAGKNFPRQIIFTASAAAHLKMSKALQPSTSGGSIPYMLSKAATAHLVKILAHEFVPLGIQVNGIAPGPFSTNMYAATNELGITPAVPWPGGPGYPFVLPSGRSGAASDVGSLAIMLVKNEFINGEIVMIDGGMLICSPATH
ncbi:NAD(P)-binding protein [Exidia glandulosa HHB12029]|uniref:NAD(P)-binding protein n=1 Tax=Exidia glandulosa HHB12029 TaxID=1314781 RepID=A0A165NST0_EXIGL|nr:NAD(P)-binding protein [Exidia glandulosa HHB12029]